MAEHARWMRLADQLAQLARNPKGKAPVMVPVLEDRGS